MVDVMAPESTFSSPNFLNLPKRQQNELIYSLLYPLARSVIVYKLNINNTSGVRYDLEKEVELLREKKIQVEQKLAEMEKSICDAASTFDNGPRTPSDISQKTRNKNNYFRYGQQVKSTKTRFVFHSCAVSLLIILATALVTAAVSTAASWRTMMLMETVISVFVLPASRARRRTSLPWSFKQER